MKAPWIESKNLSGGKYKEATPVPIPNTEVKLFSADDTWTETSWENRSLPDLYHSSVLIAWSCVLFMGNIFFMMYFSWCMMCCECRFRMCRCICQAVNDFLRKYGDLRDFSLALLCFARYAVFFTRNLQNVAWFHSELEICSKFSLRSCKS